MKHFALLGKKSASSRMMSRLNRLC